MSQEETIKLAKELYAVVFDESISPLDDSGYKEEIMIIAKHVQKLILESKIEHLSHIHTLDEIDRDIEQLQHQLESLNKREGN